MTFQTFLSKINRRQILIHFIASWFLLQAFNILVYLTDIKLLKLLEVNQLTPEGIRKIMNQMSGQDIAYYAILTSTAGFVGTIVAFIISLFISIKNHWFWFNSLIVVITINLLSFLNVLGWHILRSIFLAPGNLFNNHVVEFSINGIYLLLFGIVLFFSKKTNLFINNNFQSTVRKDILLAAIKFHQFILKLNWRQIAIHFIATWFLIYAFQTLSLLHDTTILNIIKHSSEKELIQSVNNNKALGVEFISFSYISDMSKFVAVLTAFIISLMISIKKEWFWFNSFIVLIVAYFLNRFDLLGWDFLKKVALLPGRIFKNVTADYFTSGSILLLISFLLFFLPFLNNFIGKGNRISLSADQYEEQENYIPK
jgi:hypothetical protein